MYALCAAIDIQAVPAQGLAWQKRYCYHGLNLIEEVS